MEIKNTKRRDYETNLLFTSFKYDLTDNGAGAPDADSYIKKDIYF